MLSRQNKMINVRPHPANTHTHTPYKRVVDELANWGKGRFS